MTHPKKPMIMGAFSTPELAYLADAVWHFTEKIDGMNMRIMWDGAKVSFGGRTENANIPGNLVKRLTERFVDKDSPLYADLNKVFGVNPAIMYGEGYGAGIQSGGHYRKDQDFILFDVFINNYWLNNSDVKEIAQTCGLPIAPTVGCGTLYDGIEMVRGGMKSLICDGPSEGIIARPMVQMFDRYGQRIITKIKCVDWKV